MIKKLFEILGALISVFVGIYSTIIFWASSLAVNLSGSATEYLIIKIGALILGLSSLYVLYISIKSYNNPLKKYPLVPIFVGYVIMILLYILFMTLTSHPALSSQ